VTYLGGHGVISCLGDQFFIYENFLTTGSPYRYPITVQPMGLPNMPWDLVVLVAFGLAMFGWAYYSALRFGAPARGAIEPSRDATPAPPARA
jgi:hypothetical protein